MHSLQDKIMTILDDAYVAGNKDDGWEPTFEFDKEADAILALIAEAMLSEEAVEAGATAVAKDPDKWGYNIILDAYRGVLREGIQSALTAAGVTGAGQEGGEGE